MTVNANHVVHTTCKKNYDVVHITEAGLGKKLPNTLEWYNALKQDHNYHNRGSLLYIQDYLS